MKGQGPEHFQAWSVKSPSDRWSENTPRDDDEEENKCLLHVSNLKNAEDHNEGKWSNIPCRHNKPFVCQYKVGPDIGSTKTCTCLRSAGSHAGYKNAKQICKNWFGSGSRLPDGDTDEELDEIFAIRKAKKLGVWLGGTYDVKTDTAKTSSGAVMTTEWAQNPSKGCLSTWNRKLFTQHCDNIVNVVCAVDCDCIEHDIGWKEFSGFYYKWFEGPKNFTGASELCAKEGGSLATAENAEMNNFIYHIRDQNSIKDNIENKNIWLNANWNWSKDEWKWLNSWAPEGTLITWTKWNIWPGTGRREPSKGKNNNCLLMLLKQGGVWSDVPCDLSYSVMCRRGLGSTESCTCLRDAGYHIGFENAKQICKNKFGPLARLPDGDTAEQLAEIWEIRNNKGLAVWLGGSYDIKTDTAKTSSGAVMTTEWCSGDPIISRVTKGCLGTWDRKLITQNCNGNWMNVVCEVDCDCKATPNTMPFAQIIQEDKSQGTQCTSVSCFKLFTLQKTWQRARGICIAKGGHLAEVKTADEAKALEMLQNSLNDLGIDGGFWLGGAKVDSQWRWYHSNTSISMKNDGSYNSWRENQLYNEKKENCLSHGKTINGGNWEDDYCSWRMSFVCQFDENDNKRQPKRGLKND